MGICPLSLLGTPSKESVGIRLRSPAGMLGAGIAAHRLARGRALADNSMAGDLAAATREIDYRVGHMESHVEATCAVAAERARRVVRTASTEL